MSGRWINTGCSVVVLLVIAALLIVLAALMLPGCQVHEHRGEVHKHLEVHLHAARTDAGDTAVAPGELPSADAALEKWLDAVLDGAAEDAETE